MTPVADASASVLALLSVAIDRSHQSRCARGQRGVRAEQFLHAVSALLHPGQRQPEVGDDVAYRVEGRVAGDQDEQLALGQDRAETTSRQLGREKFASFFDL